ncbi:carbon-nitrogen hydrolase family protein [Myxococcus sp. K15C18031901]|uniref:carbon-nitrogen hydrolase family protein n=1 Tax=Myxococcus dinghuensis TaxID=2906761 RepID=UPI0020A6EFAD|nr:carbon-nitrogen hydrolase family protein [Myxococcus dinghuensis]MCP3098096.1 carbon-nitrogen hydrolase family protein [Myxococcus dinghuensis]
MRLQVHQSPWLPDAGATLEAVERELRRSVTRGTDFVVLPEHVLGDPARTPPDAGRSRRALELFTHLARELEVYVATGSWLEHHEGRVVNVARVLDRAGRVCATVRQPHEGGAPVTGTDFPLFDTDKGKVGLLLGHDFWVMESSRIQSLRGAHLVLVPGTLGTRNRESKKAAIWGIATLNCVAVAFASTVGGGSTLALPQRIVAQADEAPGVLTAEWADDTMTLQREADLSFKNTLWFGLWARRPELYAPLTAPADRSTEAA